MYLASSICISPNKGTTCSCWKRKQKMVETRWRTSPWPQRNTRDYKTASCVSEAMESARLFKARCKPGARIISQLGSNRKWSQGFLCKDNHPLRALWCPGLADTGLIMARMVQCCNRPEERLFLQQKERAYSSPGLIASHHNPPGEQRDEKPARGYFGSKLLRLPWEGSCRLLCCLASQGCGIFPQGLRPYFGTAAAGDVS